MKSMVDRLSLTVRVVPIMDLSTVSGPEKEVSNEQVRVTLKPYYPTQDPLHNAELEDGMEVRPISPSGPRRSCLCNQRHFEGWGPVLEPMS